VRLAPDTLFGRLVLTLVSGVALTMLVTVLVQIPERDNFVFRVSASRAAYRLADFIHFVDAARAAERAHLLEGGVKRGIVATLDVAPGPRPSARLEPRAAKFLELLQDNLGAPRPLSVAVSDVEVLSQQAEDGLRAGYAFDVRTRLEDGTWARFEVREARRLSLWPRRLIQNLLLMLAMVALLALLVVRWVTRPFDQLAFAAEQLGRDINRPPLPETGPQEVRRAARAFNAMQQRLQNYIGSRTAMLAALSHDLKTPITRMRLRAEMLEPPEAREKMVRDLTEMDEMVSTTLGYLRGLDTAEPLSVIDVSSLLEALQADAGDMGRQVRVRANAVRNFLGKPQALKRVLQNLLDNALRYGRGDVEIAAEDTPKALVLRVRDRGPGVPEADLARVFDPFVRLEGSRNPGTGGTGLGLSIARALAQSMGGEVMLRNRHEGGLEAIVELPR
jgi:signal transduction histidine kinase